MAELRKPRCGSCWFYLRENRDPALAGKNYGWCSKHERPIHGNTVACENFVLVHTCTCPKCGWEFTP